MWKKGKNGGAIIKRAFSDRALFLFATRPQSTVHGTGHPKPVTEIRDRASLLKPVDKENGIVRIIKLHSLQHRVIGTTDLFILHEIPELSRK